jgi:signal transduction histidine kinase/AmiR/NasT family two-component response regulator
MRPFGVFALVAAVLFGACVLAIDSTSLSGGTLVFWPADGIILGLMLAPFRRRAWLVLVAGLASALLAFVLDGRQMVLAVSRVGIMAVSIPMVFLLARRIIGQRSIAELRALLPFLLTCGLVAVGVSFLRSAAISPLVHIPIIPLSLTTATATFTSYAFVTPLILLLTQPRDAVPINWRAELAKWGIIAAYSGGIAAAFLEPRYPTLCLIPLALILVAHAVDFTGIVVVILVTASMAVGLTLAGLGPLAHFQGDLKLKILLLQAFLVIITCATLPISALMSDHSRLKRSLIAALEEAKAGSQAKSTFLATISHEIRTPLNGVLGMAQAMQMDELSPAQKERIGVVLRSGAALLTVLNDVLDISKIEAGKLTIENIEFDLAGVVDLVVLHNRAVAEQKGLTVTSCTAEAEGVFVGDPTRLRQIVNNLLSNAIKFTEAGGVSVTATYAADQLRLSVRDTGMGIPADKIGGLFEKFRQVDESTTRRFGGTGLGLSICRELVLAMGGDITVESEEGAGACFIVTLPIRRIRSGAVEPDASEAEPHSAAQFDLRVLAAEDNLTNQLVLKALLGAVGLAPTIVDNGADAVAAWRIADWDLVLMDVQMPVMDGPTAVREIRAEEAAQGRARTLVYAFSANAMSHHIRDYLDAGMDGHIAKPISIQALVEVLAEAQARAASETAIRATVRTPAMLSP